MSSVFFIIDTNWEQTRDQRTWEKLSSLEIKITLITWGFDWIEANSLSFIPEDFCMIFFPMAEEGKLISAHLLGSIDDTIKDV